MKRFLAVILIFCFAVSLFSVNCGAVSASAAVVINGDTGNVIYSKNSNARLPMASTTKIMTALLLCENGDLDKEIVTTKEMVTVEGSSMGLLEGDTVSFRSLLYGMMLASGNDAANTTAIALGGSVENFVEMMNEKAQSLGLENTHFETPSGLDGKSHYTTAYELAILARYALQNPDFAEAVSSKSATLTYGNPPYRRTLTNHNRLLKTYDDIVGVKTGFTKKAGRCLVSAAKKDGKFVICVTLHDPDDWADHRKLLDIGLESLESVTVKPDKRKLKICVLGAKSKDITVDIKETNLYLSDEDISCDIEVCPVIFAPLECGEKIGTVSYRSNDTLISCEDICVNNGLKSVKTSKMKTFLEIFKYILLCSR